MIPARKVYAFCRKTGQSKAKEKGVNKIYSSGLTAKNYVLFITIIY